MSDFEFDAIVIGAGIAGVSVAAHLASSWRVLVVEQEDQPGYHSTGRSAALFSPTYGPEPVRTLTRASHSFFASPPPGFFDGTLVTQRDVLCIANESQLAKLNDFANLPDIALTTTAISAEEAIKLCPILRPEYVAGALLEGGAADIDVHSLHYSYIRKFRALGGRLVTKFRVEALSYENGVWHVAGRTRFSARIVVNAAGAWADRIAKIAGVVPIGLQPTRRTACLVEAPSATDIAKWPMVRDAGEEFYFKPDAGLLLLSPADETPCEPCDAAPDEWDIAVAVDRIQTATYLTVKRIRHRWAGLRSFVSDRVPVVGYDPDWAGFFWLAGQGGYGIQTAPALSELAAALLLEKPLPGEFVDIGLDASDLAPTRFRNITAANLRLLRAIE